MAETVAHYPLSGIPVGSVPAADLVTCGTCGASFPDIYPAARCPYEGEHAEAESGLQFRVWNEVGDLFGEYDDRAEAEKRVRAERAACDCGETADMACGILHPHGIHLQICEDGTDVTAHDHGQYF